MTDISSSVTHQRLVSLTAALGNRWSIDHTHDYAATLIHADGHTVFAWAGAVGGSPLGRRIWFSPALPGAAGDGVRGMTWDDRRYGGPEPVATIAADRLDTPEGAAKAAREILKRVVTPLVAAWPAIVADCRASANTVTDTLATAKTLAQAVGRSLSELDEREARGGRSVSVYFPAGRALVYGQSVTFERMGAVSPEVALQIIALLPGKGV